MKSMTGYAALDRDGRRWDIRAVNGRGLDMRIRVPDQPAGLDPIIRETVGKRINRGNVTVSLRLSASDDRGPVLNTDVMAQTLSALKTIEDTASSTGVALAPFSAADVLAMRGVWDAGEAGPTATPEDLKQDIQDLVTAFDASRAEEGARLRQALAAQIDDIEALVQQAIDLGPARTEHMAQTYQAAMDRLTQDSDDSRIAQDVAALIVKGDITEELDRLTAHIAAARDLLDQKKPVGRRFDFLTQEFNREANTLCSKAQMVEVTRIGLDLKTLIDRMREQVQNVE